MNWIPVLTHFGAILFGIIVASACWAILFRDQDRALAEADEEIERLGAERDQAVTRLAAEKAENAALCETNDMLRGRLAKFGPKPRDAKGHFLKVAA